MNKILLLCFFATLIFSCTTDKNNISEKDLSLSWEVKENFYLGKYQSRNEFVFTNKSNSSIGNNWEIYFNLVRKIIQDSSNVITGNVNILHVNGDLFKLIPNSNFNLASGDSISIGFTTSDWIINTSDAPAGVYIVFSDNNGNELKPELLSNYTVKPFQSEKQTKRAPEDNMIVPTAASRFADNAYIQQMSANELPPFLPAPSEYKRNNGSILLTAEYFVDCNDNSLQSEVDFLKKSLQTFLEKPLTATSNGKIISIKIGNVSIKGKQYSAGSNAYSLAIAENKISIIGTDKVAVFYGIQSLRQLLPPTNSEPASIENIVINDKPRFNYRGMELDVARNFQPKSQVLKLLDLMALYKLNKFHFHLSDDEGWRVELPGLPELTEIGGKRGHDKTAQGMVPSFGSGPIENATTGSGFYTKADFIEIVKYASERHIEIIPEIDGPGHIRAAIKSMDKRYERLLKEGKKEEAEKYILRDFNDTSNYRSVQLWNDNVLCPCQESTYNFMDVMVQGFIQLFNEAGTPLKTFHIGGDEVPEGVWEGSPLCQALLKNQPDKFKSAHDFYHLFVERTDNILKKYNLNTAGWEEVFTKKSENKFIAKPEMIKSGYQAYIWNNIWGWGTEDNAYILANAGQKVVLGCATNLYFDLAYNKDPEEPGYYWATHCDLRRPFEFVPLDIYKSAVVSRMGDKLESKKVGQGKTKLTETGKQNIIGIQGHLWGENAKNTSVMEHLIFPRLIALAHRAWSEEPTWSLEENDDKRNLLIDKDYNVFLNVLAQKELPRLDNMYSGINYFLPLPGAIIKEGKLYVNNMYPGYSVRYTTDGSEPTVNSTEYSSPIDVSGNVKLKTFATNGRGSRTAIVIK